MGKLTSSQMKALRRARANVAATFTSRPKPHTIGWCMAFMQWGRIHVVQRAGFAS